MKKQVFAILLATLLILATFAACGKKYLVYTDEDGIKHPLLTDAEGNTMVNEFGQIVVGVTDARGRLVTDANGENETRAITFPAELTYGNTYETPSFKLTLPEKLWRVDGNQLQKKDSEIVVEINCFGEKSLEDAEANFEEIVPQLQAVYPNNVTYESEYFNLTNGVPVYSFKVKMVTDDAAQYLEGYYFISGGQQYKFLVSIPEAEKDTLNFVDILNMIKFR